MCVVNPQFRLRMLFCWRSLRRDACELPPSYQMLVQIYAHPYVHMCSSLPRLVLVYYFIIIKKRFLPCLFKGLLFPLSFYLIGYLVNSKFSILLVRLCCQYVVCWFALEHPYKSFSEEISSSSSFLLFFQIHMEDRTIFSK